jgi:hypothetical protein
MVLVLGVVVCVMLGAVGTCGVRGADGAQLIMRSEFYPRLRENLIHVNHAIWALQALTSGQTSLGILIYT